MNGVAARPASRLTLGIVELVLTLFVASAGLVGGRLYPYWKQHLYVPCPLLDLTGIPCPACGGTRAIAALAQGAWLDALSWNPGVALAGSVALLWLPLGTFLLLRPSSRPSLPTRAPAMVRWGLPLLLAANWVYLGFWFRG